MLNAKTNIILSSIVTTILLVGCGDDTTNDTAVDGDVNTGYFIDAAVIGAKYNTSSGLSGTTGANGTFKYKEGDSVSFSLGKLMLGESKPSTDGLITPRLLVVGDNSQATQEQEKIITLMLQTLQSLDSDNDITNGITISSLVIDSLDELNESISFSTLDESTLIGLDNKYDLGLDEDYDNHLDINEDISKNHFDQSMQNWQNEDDHGLNDNTQNANETDSEHNNKFILTNYPLTQTLNQDLKDSLAYMGNEERLAYDIYTNLYDYWLTTNSIDISQFTNIATKSETKHIEIVQSLVQRYKLNATDLTQVDAQIVQDNSMSATNMPSGVYDIQKIQELYDTLYTYGQESQEKALKVGCMVEVTDINDLDKYLTQAQNSNASDVIAGFEVLRDGSYRHYWAFDKALKNMGIINGCYYDSDELLTNKEGVYPTNKNEEDNGHSDNNSEGNGYQHGKK